MARKIEKETEEKIYRVAQEVFIQKGFDGARMQDIADRAELSKSMLHYYYRSKDKLFEEVFRKVLIQHNTRILQILNSDLKVEEKLTKLIFEHFENIVQNPDISLFILNEISKNQEKFSEVIDMSLIISAIDFFGEQVEKEAKVGNIRYVSARDLIVDLISLLEYPSIASTLIKKLYRISEKEEFIKLIEIRKQHVLEIVLNQIRIR